MFDSLVTAAEGTRGAAAAQTWTRVEAAACARRIAGMVDMLEAAYTADPRGSRDQWCLDNWSAVCAQIGAILRVTSGVASNFLLIGYALRERFARISELFAAGMIGYPVVKAIVTRTTLVTDPVLFDRLDAVLASQVLGWAPMSVYTTEKTIDAILEGMDPQAVHRTKTKARSRGVEVRLDEGSGMAAVFITLFAQDAAAFDQRVTAMAATVCPADPRTVQQRRADAVGAWSVGADRLACLCGEKDCPASELPAASGVVVYVVARHDTITDPPTPTPPAPAPPPPPATTPEDEPPADPRPDAPDADADSPTKADDAEDPAARGDVADDADGREGSVREELRPNHTPASETDLTPTDEQSGETDARGERVRHELQPSPTPTIHPVTECAGLDGTPPPLPKPLREMTLAEALAPEPGVLSRLAPGYLMAGAVLPGSVSRRAALNATFVTILHPGQAPPENRYTPSKKLADFVRARDLTCRFPGCRKPATASDIDHTVPYPFGPTCASNLKCLCRLHHLLKTFWGGSKGWRDEQRPNGTVVWTDPNGKTHVTHPGSRMLFPELCTPTAPVRLTGTPPPAHTAGLTMPKRRRTRDEDRLRRVTYERDLNARLIDEEAHAKAQAKAQAKAKADATAAEPPKPEEPPPF